MTSAPPRCGCSDPAVFGHRPVCPFGLGGYRQNDPAPRNQQPRPPWFVPCQFCRTWPHEASCFLAARRG